MEDKHNRQDGDISSVVPELLLLTPAEAADLLKTSVKGIHALCRSRKLGFVQLNAKERRFTGGQIQDYIDAQTVTVDVKGGKPGHCPSPRNRQFAVDGSRPESLPCPRKGGDEKRSSKKKSDRETVRAQLRKELRECR